MNKLSKAKRTLALKALVEGCSINSTVRMTGVSKPAVLKLLVDAGKACADYQDKAFRNLKCKRVQVDEIWSFCYAKARNVPLEKRGEFGYGDVWTWTAIDADSKLVPSWLVGRRDAVCASEFITDLSERMANRIQLTSDGLKSYLDAVEVAFGSEVDYAQLVKIYGHSAGRAPIQPARVPWNPDVHHQRLRHSSEFTRFRSRKVTHRTRADVTIFGARHMLR